MSAQRKKIGILISGRGSNMAALIEAAADRDYPAEIAFVISDNPDAQGLALAASKGIPSGVVERSKFSGKIARDEAIDAALQSFGVEIVALAGYMRLLTTPFVEKWRGRMINIHPALLPLFKGLDTHKRVLDAGARVHGCTVHFVTPDMDDGPIIAQAAVPVVVGDDEATLAGRVLKAEHQLYPLALKLVAEGKARMDGGRTIFSGFDDLAQGVVSAPSPGAAAFDLEQLARITP
ncbi:MAG: phosphoribosylglycinamide formyltransferase [Rhizobiaceae bacterium]